MTHETHTPRLSKHHVKNLVISCIDFRFKDDMHGAIQKAFGITDFDEIKLAGGGGNLAMLGTEERKTTLLQDITLAVNAHKVEDIYVLTHQGCGAYATAGAAFTKETLHDEKKFHGEELEKAKAFIAEKFPAVRVHTAFAEVDNTTDEVTLCI